MTKWAAVEQRVYSSVCFPHTVCSFEFLEVIATMHLSSMFLETMETKHDSAYGRQSPLFSGTRVHVLIPNSSPGSVPTVSFTLASLIHTECPASSSLMLLHAMPLVDFVTNQICVYHDWPFWPQAFGFVNLHIEWKDEFENRCSYQHSSIFPSPGHMVCWIPHEGHKFCLLLTHGNVSGTVLAFWNNDTNNRLISTLRGLQNRCEHLKWRRGSQDPEVNDRRLPPLTHLCLTSQSKVLPSIWGLYKHCFLWLGSSFVCFKCLTQHLTHKNY